MVQQNEPAELMRAANRLKEQQMWEQIPNFPQPARVSRITYREFITRANKRVITGSHSYLPSFKFPIFIHLPRQQFFLMYLFEIHIHTM